MVGVELVTVTDSLSVSSSIEPLIVTVPPALTSTLSIVSVLKLVS